MKILQVICLILLLSLCSGCASASNVLGRSELFLHDDFEDTEWKWYPYPEGKSSNGFWRDGGVQSVPEVIERVQKPPNGKKESKSALKIRRKVNVGDRHVKKDFDTAVFEELKRKLIRADRPVFIVRVWLPPLNEWEDGDDFGFRHESFLENGSQYQNYSSIFIQYNKNENKLFFMYRIGTDELFYQIYNPHPIQQTGWWTLAIAFDKNGFGHYYARRGWHAAVTEDDRIFDSTQLLCNTENTRPGNQISWVTIARALDQNGIQQPYPYRGVKLPAGIDEMFIPTCLVAKHGEDALLINYFNYSFFTLGYPGNGNAGPPFVIDDYEVWVAK